MKNLGLILFCSLFLTGVYAQTPSSLYGRWQINYSDDPKTLLLQKAEVSKEERVPSWGQFIDFNEDGTYTESASAKCGMDDNRYRYTGKWTYNVSTKTIQLTKLTAVRARPNIYNQYHLLSSGSMKVMAQKGDTLTLKVVKPWEKVTEKKLN